MSGAWLPPALLPLAAAIIISVAPPGISSAESAGLPTPEVLTRSQAVDKAGARVNELKSSVADKVDDLKSKNLLEANVPDDPPLPPEPPPSPPPPTGAQMTDAIARKEAAAELFETVVDPDELNSYYVLKGSSGSSSSGAPKGVAQGVVKGGVKGGEGAPSEESARRARGGKPRDESQEKRLEDEKRQKSAGVKFSKKKYSNAEVFQARTYTRAHTHAEATLAALCVACGPIHPGGAILTMARGAILTMARGLYLLWPGGAAGRR